MRLQHYSQKPLALSRARTYSQADLPVTWSKPRGLWVSVAGTDDWPAWCRSEDYCLERLTHCADIELAAQHHVHVITTVEDLHDFTRRYRTTTPPAFEGATPGAVLRLLPSRRGIDWDHVAREHDGVIVTPWLYQWHWGLDHPLSWLYSWDCASGCIWNLDAIATVTATLQAVTR